MAFLHNNNAIRNEYLSNNYVSELINGGETWTFGSAAGHGVAGVNVSTPVTTAVGGANWKRVSAGALHSAGIKTDGTLWTWGQNTKGQLGNNTTSTCTTPVTVSVSGPWAQVSCGYRFMGAVKTDGTLWMCGYNPFANLAVNNGGLDVSTPVQVTVGGTNWKQVSCGVGTAGLELHAGAVKTDGTLWMWGQGLHGRLGNNSTLLVSTPVTTAVGGTNWKQVSCGGDCSSGIKTDGTLWVWGGAISIGIGGGEASTPVTTAVGGTNWKQVSCGYQATAGIKTDGTLWVWGWNTNGRLGTNTITGYMSTPVTIATGGTNWKEVSMGHMFGSAVKTDGTLWTWGQNTVGQLGNNSTTTVSTPITTTLSGTNWKQSSAGNGSGTAVRLSQIG